ncbi:MAG: nuclear transport factor 2 family protein [Acidobacteria bacterium]|nr:nuclear transport factor 2 family protein [Acidobacteriota bacterium]MCK6681386.1 nuclear transport factor 2 family protein [Thermoanaerobaculia bacterium]
MHPNEKLIHDFYDSLKSRDGVAMGRRYHDEGTFSDPVFQNLSAPQVRAMWKMLCERGTDLRVEATGISADDVSGRAHWEAWYTFSKTGQKVHNVIDATFEFKDGRIYRHVDSFDLTRWARMALGLKGKLFGWLPAVHTAIRQEALRGLGSYMRREFEGR